MFQTIQTFQTRFLEIPRKFSKVNHSLVELYVPGLVNAYITMENHNFQWVNPLFLSISMAIFNSYVTNYQRVIP